MNYQEYLISKPCLLETFHYQGNSYIEKYVNYRTIEDYIDIDVTIYNMYLFCTCFDFLDVNAETCILPQTGYSKRFRLYLHTSDKIQYRGDTGVNAYEVMKQLVYADTGEFWGNDAIKADKAEFLAKLFSVCEKYGLTEELNQHIRLCYGIGNFYPIPYTFIKGIRTSLNQIKGNLIDNSSGKGFVDVMQEFLLCMYKFFMGEEVSQGKEIINNLNDNYMNYIKLFGSGEQGWENFIDWNYFQEFVDENYQPILFWKVDKDNPVEGIKTYLKEINKALSYRENRLAEKLNTVHVPDYVEKMFENAP